MELAQEGVEGNPPRGQEGRADRETLRAVAGTIVGGALGGPAGAMLGSKVGRLAGSIDDDGLDAYGDYEDDLDTPEEMDGEDFLSLEGEGDGMADYMADIAARAPSPTDAAAMAGAGTDHYRRESAG